MSVGTPPPTIEAPATSGVLIQRSWTRFMTSSCSPQISSTSTRMGRRSGTGEGSSPDGGAVNGENVQDERGHPAAHDRSAGHERRLDPAIVDALDDELLLAADLVHQH